ncbi:MAG: hypothetical protein R2831_02595 [Chitinophagaceae bacterium]
MRKNVIALALTCVCITYTSTIKAQTDKNKKSRYYQNSTTTPEEFDVQGFFTEEEKKEVESTPKKEEYRVKVKRNANDSKYYDEQRVIVRETPVEVEVDEELPAKPKKRAGYYTTYGEYRPYNENRASYDKYYNSDGTPVANTRSTATPPPPPPPPPSRTRRYKKDVREEREIKMTSNELEYKTTVVKKRYTNLDVLCDDLDLAKIQRPVFKGICTECSRDVDAIITNKNLSSLEKNYRLKQCYMQRDKRLRETIDEDQYRKWIRIKDADEYLIITRDTEMKDGVNK